MSDEIKNEGTRTKNEALRTLGKLIMNVGYGYTGMRRDDKTALKSIDEYNSLIEKGVKIKHEISKIFTKRRNYD